MERWTWIGPIRRLPLASVLAGGLALLGGQVQAAPETYVIDPRHTTVAFLVHHIGYQNTLGQFLEVEGSFVFDEETQDLDDLQVSISSTSVFSNDEPRDKHVRGGDFLDVESHPEITFHMREAKATSAESGQIMGDLTILGVTQPVTLDVTLNKIGPYPFPVKGSVPYVLGVSARATVKRSDFGMTYAVENGLVGDEVQVIIEAEAVRQ